MKQWIAHEFTANKNEFSFCELFFKPKIDICCKQQEVFEIKFRFKRKNLARTNNSAVDFIAKQKKNKIK